MGLYQMNVLRIYQAIRSSMPCDHGSTRNTAVFAISQTQAERQKGKPAVLGLQTRRR